VYNKIKYKAHEYIYHYNHAPTENKDETDKVKLFEEVATIYDEAPGNTIKIIVGDCNAKLGKESSFRPTIGMHSAHEISNNNG